MSRSYYRRTSSPLSSCFSCWYYDTSHSHCLPPVSVLPPLPVLSVEFKVISSFAMLSVGNPSIFPAHFGGLSLNGVAMATAAMPPVLPILPGNEMNSPSPDMFAAIRSAGMDSGVVSGGRSAVAAAAAASTGSKAGSENAPAMDGSNSSGRSTPSGGDQPHNKLFVGGLSWQTSADKLREYFGQYGTIIDVQVLKDPLTQRSRGFGFITFAEAGSVDRVLAVAAHTLDGKKIDPKHATPKNKGKAAATSKTKKVFVGGVSQDTSADEVKAYFSQFGRVEEAVMLMDQQTKRHRGFGFVTFESEEVVDRICEIHYHTIKNKKVECKKAQPKEAILASTTTALLAAKRSVLLNGLGVGHMPPGHVAQLGAPNAQLGAAQQFVAAQAAQVQAAVAAQAQSAAAAAAGYGKLIASYPALASYRYSPYSLPGSAASGAGGATVNAGQSHNAAVAAAMAQQQQQQQQQPNAAAAAAAAAAGAQYQGYSLANVDMSSFQGVDWSSIYGMGMYV